MKNTTYSKNIAEAINCYLNENEWYFSFDEEDGVFQFPVAVQGKIKNVYSFVDVQKDSYTVLAYVPIGADASDSKIMSAMAEFICRANYGLDNGNFELDMDDGEIRYKCFVDCDGILPSSDIIENSIYCPIEMFERYGEGFAGVILGELDAREAVEKCENATEEMLRSTLSETGIEDDGEPDMPMYIKMQLFGSEGGTH